MRLQPSIEPGILIRTVTGRITFWSEELHLRYGFSSDEAIGQDAHELLRTSHLQTRHEIDSVLAIRSEWKGGLIAYRADGEPVIVANHWFLHRDADGLGTLVTEMHTDIAGLGTPTDALADVMTTVAGDLSQPLTALGCLIDGVQRAAHFVGSTQGQMDHCLSEAAAQLDRASDIVSRVRAIGETQRYPRLAALHARLAATMGQTESAMQRTLDVQLESITVQESSAAIRQRARAVREARRRTREDGMALSERALALQSIQVYRRRLDLLRSERPNVQTEQVLTQLLQEEEAKLASLQEPAVI